MNTRINKKGFTLLEVIIVVIIVGVLMSLALPRFFSVVEQSRGAEALQNISALRGSVVRCALRLGNYGQGCTLASLNLDTVDPSTAPNSHFAYTLALSNTTFSIQAQRNSRAGGDGNSVIWLFQNDPGNEVRKGGNGPFAGI